MSDHPSRLARQCPAQPQNTAISSRKRPERTADALPGAVHLSPHKKPTLKTAMTNILLPVSVSLPPKIFKKQKQTFRARRESLFNQPVERFVHQLQITHELRLISGFGFHVLGFGFHVLGFELRISCAGFRVLGFEFRVSGFESRVSGFGFWVSDFGFRVSSFGFRVSSFEFRVEILRFRVHIWGFG